MAYSNNSSIEFINKLPNGESDTYNIIKINDEVENRKLKQEIFETDSCEDQKPTKFEDTMNNFQIEKENNVDSTIEDKNLNININDEVKNKKLKQEIFETDSCEDQKPTKFEDTMNNFQIKKENNVESTIEDKNFSTKHDIRRCNTTMEGINVKREINTELIIKSLYEDQTEEMLHTEYIEETPTEFVNVRDYNEIIIKKEISDTSDNVFKCESCEMTFSMKIQLTDHSFWCKRNKESVEAVKQIQNNCESDNSNLGEMGHPEKNVSKSSRKRCVVSGCKNSQARNRDISFHYFPKKGASFIKRLNHFGNEEKIDRRDAWMKNVHINIKSDVKSLVVCSTHFRKEDYSLSEYPSIPNKRLKCTAVPTLNIPTLEMKTNKVKQKSRGTRNNLGNQLPKTAGTTNTAGKVKLCEQYKKKRK